MNYELKIDPANKRNSARYYVRGKAPSTYITDNMTYVAIMTVAKALKQLGHTVERV